MTLFSLFWHECRHCISTSSSSPSRPFLIERLLRSKNFFSKSWRERPKTFPDPLCHFGAPWRPFWILQAVRRCRRLASAPFSARLVLHFLYTGLNGSVVFSDCVWKLYPTSSLGNIWPTYRKEQSWLINHLFVSPWCFLHNGSLAL